MFGSVVRVEGCVGVKEERRRHAWPSWILVRHMTVCGRRNCSIEEKGVRE